EGRTLACHWGEYFLDGSFSRTKRTHTMLQVLIKIFEAFATEIAKRFAAKVTEDKGLLCRQLLRLHLSLDELLAQAGETYECFREYASRFNELKGNNDYKLLIRTHMRELL